jgi:protease-4
MSNVNVQPLAPGYAPPPRRSGCLVALTVLLAVLLGLSVLANMAFLSRGGGALRHGVREPEPLGQKWVAGSGEAKVALVELNGVISSEVATGGVFGVPQRPVERIRRELDEAAKDDAVKAVLFSVDSPGGTITASDEILEHVRRWKERTKKKLVVHMGGICASGGYYVSSAADEIVAEPTTITGSIGVILSSFNFAGTLGLLKIDPVTIKSGANKDLLNPFEPLKEAHLRIIQDMIDHAYGRFVGVVAKGRGIPEDEVRQLADGRIYTADDALRLKLIDKIGYREDAFEEAKRLAGASEATLFRYTRPPSILDALAGDVEARLPERDAAAAAIGAALATPRICYLWEPAAGALAK